MLTTRMKPVRTSRLVGCQYSQEFLFWLKDVYKPESFGCQNSDTCQYDDVLKKY
jgi:hypothetical protein